MDRTALDDVEQVPHFMGVNSDRRPLAQALDGMGFAVTYFELDPGEAFSGGLHTHTDQEELFLVLEGEATWETQAGPGEQSETTTVGPREAIHFEAGDAFQQGRNESDGTVTGLAMGVPGSRHDTAGIRSLADCPDCGAERVFAFAETEGRLRDPADATISCTDCGAEL
jgi:uncharacterized cupin superfamily protein